MQLRTWEMHAGRALEQPEGHELVATWCFSLMVFLWSHRTPRAESRNPKAGPPEYCTLAVTSNSQKGRSSALMWLVPLGSSFLGASQCEAFQSSKSWRA